MKLGRENGNRLEDKSDRYRERIRRGLKKVADVAKASGDREEPRPERRKGMDPRGVNSAETDHAEAERGGIQQLQQTAEMADPIGCTLEPVTAPQNVQHLVGLPGSDGGGRAAEMAGLGGKLEVDEMVTGFGGGSEPARRDDDMVSVGLSFGDTSDSAPDDGVILPGEGGEFKW